MKVHFSSATPEWATPHDFFKKCNKAFGPFTLDPCCTRKNAKCRRFFTAKEDGLSQNWRKHRVFMNPPYGRTIGLWMKKALESARGGGLSRLLGSSANGYGMVARLRDEGQNALYSWALEVRGSQEFSPIPFGAGHFLSAHTAEWF